MVRLYISLRVIISHEFFSSPTVEFLATSNEAFHLDQSYFVAQLVEQYRPEPELCC